MTEAEAEAAPPTDTAIAARALLERLDNPTYRGVLENRAVLWGWQGARQAGNYDSRLSDAVAKRALDGIWDLLEGWAAEAGWLPALREEDLRIEVFRPAVPNAVCSGRVTHIPTGITAASEDRSQIQAKSEAITELRHKVAKADVTAHA